MRASLGIGMYVNVGVECRRKENFLNKTQVIPKIREILHCVFDWSSTILTQSHAGFYSVILPLHTWKVIRRHRCTIQFVSYPLFLFSLEFSCKVKQINDFVILLDI